MLNTEKLIKPQHTLSVTLAQNSEEIEAALKLRYKIFVQETNNLIMRNPTGVETDEYDQYCDHLIVKDLNTNEIVGTYRLLPGVRAVQNIGFYSETEFDLSAFKENKPFTLELGRSCIAPEYRDGKVIQLLWEGIANYLADNHHYFMIGCASVHINNLQETNDIYSLLKKKEIITERFGIKPLATHRVDGLQEVKCALDEKAVFRKLPPLMKGYQWLGAEIGGEPAYDKVFETVDFFIILQTERITRRYRRRFLAN